jgi:hypothetical protein
MDGICLKYREFQKVFSPLFPFEDVGTRLLLFVGLALSCLFRPCLTLSCLVVSWMGYIVVLSLTFFSTQMKELLGDGDDGIFED